MAVDETKLKVKGQEVYIWAAIDTDTKLLALITGQALMLIFFSSAKDVQI